MPTPPDPTATLTWGDIAVYSVPALLGLILVLLNQILGHLRDQWHELATVVKRHDEEIIELRQTLGDRRKVIHKPP